MEPGPVVFLDIDGVLTVSWRPIDGAPEAVDRLRRLGWRVAFVTNTTSATRRRVVERLAAAGIGAGADEVFTAPRATAAYLRRHHPGARCLLVNDGSVEEDLDGVVLADDGAEVVVTGGAGPAIGYDTLNRAHRLLLAGAPLVAMHRNLHWETADGLQLDMGAFLVGLEQSAGVEAVVVGKPAAGFFEAVLGELGVGPDRAVMVGDDLEADVLGAQAAGIRAVLVRTGKFREDAYRRAPVRPDAVVDSVADVPGLLGAPA